MKLRIAIIAALCVSVLAAVCLWLTIRNYPKAHAPASETAEPDQGVRPQQHQDSQAPASAPEPEPPAAFVSPTVSPEAPKPAPATPKSGASQHPPGSGHWVHTASGEKFWLCNGCAPKVVQLSPDWEKKHAPHYVGSVRTAGFGDPNGVPSSAGAGSGNTLCCNEGLPVKGTVSSADFGSSVSSAPKPAPVVVMPIVKVPVDVALPVVKMEAVPPPPPPPPPTKAAPPATSLADVGKSPIQYSQKTTYDFEDDVIEGDLTRPDATSAQPAAPPPIERYPNIEAPDTVAMGQEIAVQVSLTSEQLASETKIISGVQHEGKVQLQMAAGEDQWTLTVNLTAPGMEFTRSGNTADIIITRTGDSTLAVFYLRPAASASQDPRRETRILATLLHDGAFIARLSRPLTIVASINQPAAQAPASLSNAPVTTHELIARPQAALARTTSTTPGLRPSLTFDPDLYAPALTIVENRVGSTLRVDFFSPHAAPVEADISDPDALHAWIQAHYAQLANRGRGIEPVADSSQTAPQHAADYLNGFGSELYDRFAPQAFKDLFWKLIDNSTNHAPENKNAQWVFESIQVLSDDPAIPWELMRPARADGSGRMGFLGLHFMIARWPLGGRGVARPPQSLALRQSAVIAPVYQGAQQLPSADSELAAIKSMQGFAQVGGNYAAVRNLAMHPPQGIIHFAGHGGVAEEGGVPQFAILLEDSQMDPVTWQALQPTNSSSHPLFFFNACDVGESRRFLNDVDGWAPVLLSSGASGYIGALWPVNDATAEAVAASFYRQVSARLLTGSNVAMALAKARAEVFSQTSDPTALAYVFYGDPYLALTAAPASK